MTAEAQPDNDHDDTAEEVDLIEELRRRDPVDIDALPSSHSPEALRTLEQILGPDDEAGSGTKSEAETGTDESCPYPAAVGSDGEDAPPPRPTSR